MKRIVRPEPNEYTVWTLSVMAAAVAVKIVIGLYTLRRGKRLESGALKASGKDALNDAGAAALALAAGLICSGRSRKRCARIPASKCWDHDLRGQCPGP